MKLLSKITSFIEKRPWTVLISAFALTLVCCWFSQSLQLKMSFKDLMPQSHPTVQEYNKILDNYNAASNIIIGAMGDEKEMIDFVNELAPKVKELDTYVGRVDYKLNQKFISEHALMLTKAKDLKNNAGMYSDPSLIPLLAAINDNFETTYINEGEQSLSTKEKENQAISGIDNVAEWIKTMQHYVDNGENNSTEVAKDGVDKLLLGQEYYLSYNKKMILMFIKPTFPVDEMDKATILIHKLNELISETKAHYPSITMAAPAGTMALGVQETEAASADMQITSIISFILIILLFIISFRMWSAPLLAGISLIFGIIWTTGFTSIAVGSLNMMTSMFAVVLIGLGIDFNIHIISAYNENRANGVSIIDSIQRTFNKSGKGIIVGALTTALAFLTMLVSENAGMKEFALVAGSGVLFSMLSAILVLPAMLIVLDKRKEKMRIQIQNKLDSADSNSPQYAHLQSKLERKVQKLSKTKTVSFNLMGNFANAISRKPVIVLSGVIMVTVLLIYSATKIEFNYNYLSLEPDGLSSIAVQDSMIEYFDATADVVMVTTSDIEQTREITTKAKKLKKTGMVQSISDYIPSNEQYDKRLPYLQKYRKNLETYSFAPSVTEMSKSELIDELYRLEDNLIEMSQLAYMGGQDKIDAKVKEVIGDLNLPAKQRKSIIGKLVNSIENAPETSLQNLAFFEKEYVPSYRAMAIKMCNTEKLSVEKLPDDIAGQFLSADKQHYLTTIYPKEQTWNLSFLASFSKQMHKIDERVTGMPLVFYILIDYIGRDGTTAAILTLILIFVLLFVDFRSLKFTLLTMIPLVIGAVWMVGAMHLLGMKLNIMNVMAVPLILGIGIDDGVHIIHRYRIEGKHKLHTIFSSTGKAVLITSVSTFLAFGSMGFAASKGIASLGITLSIGIITCYLTTVIILPAIIALLDKHKEDRN